MQRTLTKRVWNAHFNLILTKKRKVLEVETQKPTIESSLEAV
jgi:hypothetical protein